MFIIYFHGFIGQISSHRYVKSPFFHAGSSPVLGIIVLQVRQQTDPIPGISNGTNGNILNIYHLVI
jgi:hypothetical protein